MFIIMNKFYFGVLFLFSIIIVSLIFVSGIGRNREGLTPAPAEIKCESGVWKQTPQSDMSGGYVEWTKYDPVSNKPILKTHYPANITPTCKNVVVKCASYNLISEPLFPPIQSGSNTPSTDMISWIKADQSGNPIEITSFAKDFLPKCENVPNMLPPWKTYSLGILTETKKNIDNIIQKESNKIIATKL